MTTLQGMREWCTRCFNELEIGQIGLCDSCIDADRRARAAAADDDDERCDACGGPNDDGEGWDGLCGNCADLVAEDHVVAAWVQAQHHADFYAASDDGQHGWRVDYARARIEEED